MRHSYLTLLQDTLWLDTLVRHSYLTLLQDARIWHFFCDTLTWHSCTTLFFDTLVSSLTWHSCKTFLLDILTWHTDHSHWHLLCKHQNNCGETDHSHRQVLCKRQFNCGDTDHSHRQVLCKCLYNCGDKESTWHAFEPLLTHSPLWRALRRSRKRLRTVADGCNRKGKTWRTQPHPQTPKWNGNPRYAFGKK